MNKLYLKLFLLLMLIGLRASASSYPEVLFENSLMPKSYFFSESNASGDSWINHMNGHLPVSDSVFFTPGNALLLNYVSGTTGEWKTIIHHNNELGYLARKNDILTFKIFAAGDTKIAELPLIQIMQGENVSQQINLQKYIGNYQDNTWLSIAIPIKDIENLDEQAPISGVMFNQGANDGKEHHLFIDQIEFLPSKTPDIKLTGKAVLSSVVAYERHVDIAWQLPLTPSIRYIKVYRSEDNQNFIPVGIRPISFNKFTDFVPRTNVSYYYKIAWVDYHYRESPFSDIKKADTKHASDDELLDAVEKSHISYFTDETEFNSGMHKVSPLVSDARVSVKSTGLGLLTQVIAVERKFISRQLLLDRLGRVVKFLNSATKYHGAYPELLDGRTGAPISNDSCEIAADLTSTAYLMQGLLVARSYFDKDDPEEKEIREKITALWKEVDWNAFVKGEGGHHLYSAWSPSCLFDRSSPLGGYNSSLIPYILALASPSNAISKESFNMGYKQPLKYVGPAIGRFSNSINDTLVVSEDQKQNLVYTKEQFLTDSTYYGVNLILGKPSFSLIGLQQSFLAINPKTKLDDSIDYYDNQKRLANVFYRAALNKSERFVSLTDILWPYKGDDSMLVSRFNPSAAIATYPYTPTIALDALKNYYRNLGSFLWTEYGFRDEFDFKNNWVSGNYDSLNQAIVPIMLENARTGLIWNLFMKDPDIHHILE